MKEYPFNYFTNNMQLATKYIRDFDIELNSLMNLVTFKNPNYIILNKEYVPGGSHFIPDQALGPGPSTLQIKRADGGINLYNMWPHSIIVNNWGNGDIKVYITPNSYFYLAEGFAVCNNGKDNDNKLQYSVISLDSSGAYYVLSNISTDENEKMVYDWQYYEEAIDDIGTNYLFVFGRNTSRFVYYQNLNNTLKPITDFDSATATFSYNNNLEPIIATQIGTFWSINQILSHDIIIYYSEEEESEESSESVVIDYYEEILCDEYSYNEQVVQNHMTNARSTITTNLKNCNPLKFYINFY